MEYYVQKPAIRDNDPYMVCLPVGLSTLNLRDITPFNSSFRVFINDLTGEIHDGNVYYKEFEKKYM